VYKYNYTFKDHVVHIERSEFKWLRVQGIILFKWLRVQGIILLLLYFYWEQKC